MKYSVIIPCYNEEANLGNLISRISPLQKRYDLEYVLVENGSKDDSRRYFKENIENKYPNISVVYVDVNKGYGYGLQQGMKVAKGEYVGWIHADLQIAPEALVPFFDFLESRTDGGNVFLKGRRSNRGLFDVFFTVGQAVFDSLLFSARLSDIGAIPVLFSRHLLEELSIDDMPNDFSIELYVYKEARLRNYFIKRFKVILEKRDKGSSSWNHGLKSKIRQSRVIFSDSLKIKRGEKVL